MMLLVGGAMIATGPLRAQQRPLRLLRIAALLGMATIAACARNPPVGSVSVPPIPPGEARVWFYRVYLPSDVALRHLGPPAPKPPRAPGPMAFADPDYVRSFLGSAGFEAIEMHRETPDVFASTPQEEAEHACIMGPSGRLIDEKRPDDATRQTIRREIEDAFAAHLRDGNTRLPSTVFLVTAHRPR